MWLAFAVSSSALAASDPDPDVSADLAAAQKAWNDGDRLGREAKAAASNGDADKSLMLYDQQDRVYDEAQKNFRKAIGKDPEQPQVLAAYGRFAIMRNQYVPARVRFEAALRCPRVKLLLNESEIATIMRTLGGLADRAGDVNQALDYYTQAVSLCPSDPHNPLALAIAFCALGRPEKATPLLKSWGDEKADSSGVPLQDLALRALGVYTLAVSQEESGHFEEALRAYEMARVWAMKAGESENTGVLDHATMALERLNDFLDGLRERTVAREKDNAALVARKLKPLPDERTEIAEALSAYGEGLDLKEQALKDPSFVTALARARDEHGDQTVKDALMNHPEFDRFQAAINRFNVTIAKYLRLPQASYQLGLCNFLSGDFKDARRSVETALAYSPYNLAALNLLGEVLLETGQGDQAAETFKKLLALNPESGSAHFGLGRALFYLQRNQRDCEAALAELDRAEELGLRDKSLYSNQVLVRKDGTELEGGIHPKDGGYIVELGDGTSVTVANADVQELTTKPGLRAKLAERIQRFEHGEPAVHGPVLRGHLAPHAPTGPDAVMDPWRGGGLDGQ